MSDDIIECILFSYELMEILLIQTYIPALPLCIDLNCLCVMAYHKMSLLPWFNFNST